MTSQTGRPILCDEARDLAAGFVLGALEPAEAAAVREHLATCPEPHPEFAELGAVVPVLAESAMAAPVEPPASLRDRVMAAAAAELAERTAAPLAGPAADTARAADSAVAAPIAFPTAAERVVRRPGAGPAAWLLRVAAVVAIVALAGWNVLLQGQLGASRAYEDAVAAVVRAAAEPGSMTVILSPTEDGGDARGIAAVRPDGSVVLALRDLAATSGSQVYETWLIVGQAAPVAIGSFSVGAGGTGTFTTRQADAAPGAVIALSLEPSAGSTAPRGPIVATGIAIAPTS